MLRLYLKGQTADGKSRSRAEPFRTMYFMDPLHTVSEMGETCVVFEPALDVTKVSVLHGELGRALKSAAPLVLDAGRVERVDTAALQLLAAFFRAADAAGLTVRWQCVSPPLREATELLGLAEMLGHRT